MHVPDHFLDPATSVATATVAAVGLTVAARRIRRLGTPTRPALVAATTAAVFGLQMLNFPVSGATSGHLLGGALDAAVLGPWWGMICVTLVLVVQAVAFADGGITALGTNVVLMAVVGVLVGWAVSRGVAAVIRGRNPATLALAAGLGGAVSVVATSAVFTGLFAVGGTTEVPLVSLAGSMLGVHALIGVGEAVLTGAVVALVALVAPGALALDARREPAAQTRAAWVLGLVAVVAGGALSAVASALPDGLEATALSLGFAEAVGEHWLAGLPLADYGAASGLFVGLAGLVGVALCGCAAWGGALGLGLGRRAGA